MNYKLFLIIGLSFFVGMTEADVVLWFYDLTELPDNWTNDNFTFSINGAHIDVSDEFFPDSEMDGIYGSLLSEYVIIPPDIDSVVIDVQQLVHLHAFGQSGYAAAVLTAEINASETYVLWARTASCKQLLLTDSIPIHAAITDLSPGDLIQFEFYVILNGWYGGGSCNWLLWDTQLTGCGISSLVPRTWAWIKSSL